ncbi:dethiobiotin synthase [Bradyrhizobium sp. GM7.3]
MHASIHEGARAGRADFRIRAHNDPESVENTIRNWRDKGGVGRVWIVVESVCSMDGDFAPLQDLVAIADRYDAFLLVDEVHATGVYGEQERGFTASYERCENVVVVHTCGKALGAVGALVTGARVLRDFLINRCRPFIFVTAPSPLMAIAVRKALLILREEPERQQRLPIWLRSGEVRGRDLQSPSNSQIVPYTVGDNARAMRLASQLQARGFDSRDPAANCAGRHRPFAHFTDTQRECNARCTRRGDKGLVSMSQRIVVTGTDTGIGKTVFSAGLAHLLGANYWKPIQAGIEGETDVEAVAQLGGLSADRIVPELYRLRTRTSPHHSAEIDGVRIKVDSLQVPETGERPLVIEGAGGLMVPLTHGTLDIDIFEQWRLPVVLCASTELGTINHSLLSIEALRRRQIRILESHSSEREIPRPRARFAKSVGYVGWGIAVDCASRA